MHGLKHKQQRKTGRAKKRTRSNTGKVVKKWRCSKHRQTNVLKVQNKIIQSDKETDRLVYRSTRSKRHFQRMGLTGDGQHEVTLKKKQRMPKILLPEFQTICWNSDMDIHSTITN